ncbi:putative C6 finger domain protein [Aspergillus ruber CBS 135680]|uniref:Zn(2)-C6 fungal-type domain-containing protein n=1 Tax=Aspergillus ruber (strain CBS 135680) TaxID=1388766 RepID=A0A017SKQ3_ASPRC|nr:uncharacterized protein EURHEDRAFT_513914 [Aspergillus ruber CBS 135680]EYE97356.1 hypothetical protein EURHEDRAFT_513914 [Aspergillus ruber CBS 135680]
MEASHAPPPPPSAAAAAAHAIYEPWRTAPPTYPPPSFDDRRASNPPQPPLPPPHAYPVIPNRELPQLPPDGPYGRPNSLPGPVTTPPDAHGPPPPNYRMNGAPPHEAPPHSAPADYRARLPYPPPEQPSNGEPVPAHSIPPAQYPTPVPAPIPQTPTPFDPPYYQSQAYGIRQRKAARAQQACDQCRARKAKCDEGRPSCSHCKENNLPCVYKEVPPHKQEKATQLLLDRMQQLEDRLEERMTQLQSIQVEQGSQLSRILATEAKMKEARVVSNKDPARPTSQKQATEPIPKPDMPDVLREQESKEESTSFVVGQKIDAAENVEDGLKDDDDGELSIPVEHTTAAHKLLMWPSIKSLLFPREYDEDYVMKLEEGRGLIRVYGRGEGDDTSEESVLPNLSYMASSSIPNWDEPPHSNNGSPGGGWTASGAGAAAAAPSSSSSPLKPLEHGIEESGVLTIDADTVRRLHSSYIGNLHKLHPFLDQNDLEKKLDWFIQVYCPVGPSNPGIPAEYPRGAKRKRSCDTLHGVACDVPSPATVKTDRASPRRIEQSIDNAIILLVIALGSICEWKELPVPGSVTDNPPDFRKEQIPGPSLNRSLLSPAASDSALPISNSLYAPTSSQPFNSPSLVDGRRSIAGQSSNREGPDNRHLRNMDVIPGLAYYGYATQILGALQGANGLPHVQAALLAGLYAGQLAHPFQSHGWIYQAARACQVLVRSKRYEQMSDGPLKDLVDFAYWTCLQLESDILAELDLPASGISRLEGRISLPKGRFTLSLPNEICAPSTMMMFFYSAQIHLRKVLNRVHTDLYKVEKQGQTRWSSNVQEILSMNLQLWRSSLPEVMRWRDGDPPSKEINVARMRAKYYGARYIIHRPLLYHALHFAGRATSVDSPGAAPAMSGSRSQQMSPSMASGQRPTTMGRLPSDMGTAPAQRAPGSTPGWGYTSGYTYRDLPTKLRRACKVCIDSAILSTEAFDGIEGRPVVTNIFGTAHAQFGNMLVLSATYMSNLSELVDRNILERLLRRTIRFLLQSRYISPSLRADAKILTEIYEKIFSESPGSFAN